MAEEGFFKKLNCPKCGGQKLVEIVYGSVDDSEVKEGIDFVRGENPVRKDSPTWYCKECGAKGGHAWYVWYDRFEGSSTFVME